MFKPRPRRRLPLDPPPGPDLPSMLNVLAVEYPELSGRVVSEAVAAARVAVVRLGEFAGDVEGGVASLARDRLDLARALALAAPGRARLPGNRPDPAIAGGAAPGADAPRPAAAGAGARTGGRAGPGGRAESALAQVDRFDRLFQVVLAHGRESGAPMVSVQSVCAAAAAHLGVTAVAVTAPAVTGQAQTLGVHGALARELEELQVTLGQGPSLQAIADGTPVFISDLRGDPDAATRWPGFTEAALAAGIESLYMLPMRVGAARFGVFALYLRRIADLGPGPLARRELADADVLAAIALDVLLTQAGVLTPDPRGDASEDRRFFDDRPEIHQATGMVSVQLRVDLGTALLRIRARAYAEDRRLSDLAADLVARRVRFTPEPEMDVT